MSTWMDRNYMLYKDGWYGNNCSQQCTEHCRDSFDCNHVTGQCDRGCDVGWTGSFCDKECDDGTYGYDCVNNCSGHCLNNSPCNKQTGYCDRGCNPGYTNSYCSKDTANLQKVDPKLTVPPSIAWIVGFSILLAINVFVISAILIRLWRKRSKRPQNQSDTNDDGSHYQELSVSKGDKTYQTLTIT
uniref:Multiple epidermal growth factor-like domains 10 n=1 Tax=Magallana gigas TaxID=29159 RepID=A0A8W8NTQ9_MAGGI